MKTGIASRCEEHLVLIHRTFNHLNLLTSCIETWSITHLHLLEYAHVGRAHDLKYLISFYFEYVLNYILIKLICKLNPKNIYHNSHHCYFSLGPYIRTYYNKKIAKTTKQLRFKNIGIEV